MNCTREFNTSTRNKHYLLVRPRSLNLAAVPSSSSGGAELPIHRIMSGKADHFAGFPKSHISRKYTQEDSTAGKMDKVKQVSVAANFSRRCSRVGKIQAFEDGLTRSSLVDLTDVNLACEYGNSNFV